jgi:glycosyltransferase involved in cell wall biosynthesis
VRLSIVVPVLNEAESIGPLLREISAVASSLPVEDVIIVDDGSTDQTANVVLGLKGQVPGLRLVRHLSRRGQSTAIHTGISRARGDLVVTLDGDGQNNPADIPLLFEAYQRAAGTNPRLLVAGQRTTRRDNTVRRLSSRVANAVRSGILDDGVSDTGCSLKLFRRDDFLALPFFNHIHRFIPALMKATGVEVILVGVSHRPRERGTSKYGLWDRLWVGIHDLMGVSWLIRRTPRRVDIEEGN